jgi:hypothetical protein
MMSLNLHDCHEGNMPKDFVSARKSRKDWGYEENIGVEA